MDNLCLIYMTDTTTHVGEPANGGRTGRTADVCHLELGFSSLPQEPDALREFGKQLGEQLHERFPDGISAALVIPSSWCLVHSLSIPADRFTDRAATYEFEGLVPVELETMTCAVQRTGDATAIVCGVHTEALAGLFEELEHYGVFVASATVDILLLPRVLTNGENERWADVLMDRRRLALVARGGDSESQVVRSVRLPSGSDTLQHRVARDALVRCPADRYRIWEVQPGMHSHIAALRESLAENTSLEVVPHEEAIDRVLAASTELSDSIDLRRGPLAFAGRFRSLRAPLLHAAVALAMILLAFAAMFRCKSSDYNAANSQLRTVKLEIYTATFPSTPMSAGAALRLRSERIKLEGLTESKNGGDAILGRQGIETVTCLCQAIDALPRDVKLYVDELSIDESSLKLFGRTSAHSHAGQIVQGLNSTKRLAAAPPRTKLRADRTVDFRIHADSLGP